MAPIALSRPSSEEHIEHAGLKAKAVQRNIELEAASKPPVADDFMYDFKYNHPLPTTDVLGVEVPDNCDATQEAEGIMARLSEAMGKGDAQAFSHIFLEHGM